MEPAIATDTAEEPVLVLVCRRPRTGAGKRRLARALGETFATELGELLFEAALEDARAWPGRVVIAPDRVTDAHWAGGLLPGARVIAQPAGNLGERLNAIDLQLRATGVQQVLYIGSDAPVLAADDYADARRLLRTRDVVLGPARDGGVTLMGSRVPWPDLAGLPWSTEALGTALADAMRAAGLRVGMLTERYDVDLPGDLEPLAVDLAGDVRPARRRLLHWLSHHER